MNEARASRPPVLEPLGIFALVCAAPFLTFLAENLSEGLRVGDLLGYWAGLTAAGFALYVVLAIILPVRTFRLASLIAVGGLVFLSYGDARLFFAEVGLEATGQRVGWFVVGGIALVLAVRWGGRLAFRQFLWVFAGLSLLPSLYVIVVHARMLPDQGPGLPLAEAYPLKGNSIWSGVPLRTPNLYWIVTDSYPNLAELRLHYSFDNSDFVQELESRGFYVAREAYSNYSNTKLSVPTMMNMEYPFDAHETYAIAVGDGWAPKPGRTNRGTAAAVSGDNRSVGFLKQLGYRYVHFANRSFNLLRCRGIEDVCIESAGGDLSELETNLLRRIPVDLYLEWIQGWPEGTLPRRDPEASGTGIPELAAVLDEARLPEPFFLYAHLSVPHPPFLVDEYCRVGALVASRRSFVRQMRCVNEQLLALVDQIRRDDPSAIVLLSADHGPRMTVKPGLPLFRWDREQVRETLGILNALHLPPECQRGLHPGLTPVNDMRIVFACLGGHDPQLLPERHFVVRGGPPDGGKIRRVTLE